MSIPQTTNGASFDQWRINTNTIATNLGDVATLTTTDGSDTYNVADAVSSVKDLVSKKVKRSGDTIANLTVTTTLGVGGATTLSSTLGVTGDLAVNTNKFNVASSTGNTLVAGTLGVTGITTLTTVNSGNNAVTGTLSVSSTSTLAAVNASGDVAINTNKFNVASSTGNTLVAGTLGVTGNVTLSGTGNSVGTITSGTWSATTIATNKGGTGITSYALGDIPYASGTNVLTTLAGNATAVKQFLSGTGTGSAAQAPTWSTLSVSDISNLSTWVGGSSIITVGTITTGTWNATTIATTKGGTGLTSYSTGDMLYASATNTLSVVAGNASATRKFLNQTSSVPGWSTIATSDLSDIGTWAGATTITTLGTVATGTWSATTIATSKGGTGLTSLGTSNQLLGVNGGASSLEYKSITSSDSTISISHSAGGIDIKTTGTVATDQSMHGSLGVGQQTILGNKTGASSWDTTFHSTMLEVRNAYGISPTYLITATSDSAGSTNVFRLSLAGALETASDLSVGVLGSPKFTVAASTGNTAVSGTLTSTSDLTVGTNKLTVAASTGNTAVAGTLGVSGTSTLAAVSSTSASVSGNTTLGTTSPTGSVTSITTHGVNCDIATFAVSTSSTTAGQVIAQISATTYKSAEFIIQATDGTKYHSATVKAITNGTSADSVEYAAITLGGVVAAFSVGFSTGNLQLLVTPSSATSTTFKVTGILTRT